MTPDTSTSTAHPDDSTTQPGVGAVLFDIDGTLVDSNYLHVHAWAQAFAEAGLTVDSWRVHRAIGMGSGLLLTDLVGQQDADRHGEALKDRHGELYTQLAAQQRAFDGARELVRAVAERGARTVLATSAGPTSLEHLREVLDLDDVVTGITSAKDVEHAKPSPDLVEAALEIAGVPPERAVMVGDTVWDVEAAARAGVRCVGVLTGGSSEAALREAGAVAVYPDVASLLADLDQSPLASTWR
ncbi:HAD family hydrolase [Actinotalea sp. K2]|uniref:HAD family hydrolase n=1 Tax=Actinotalea sp. K2 TaxID=2939438 RepID=UPI00201709E4|nr:HAD family hydrolase [Actinotalea sp. K2]MCL3861380.1 HAD family hydrolase [Actinotalea sp. K2]